MSGHTPGPWLVFDHYCGRDPETAGEEYARTRLVGLTQFETVAEVRHGHDEVAGDVDANARLIAAAPELLEALEAILKVRVEGWENIWAGSNRCQDIARAAIAKATVAFGREGV